MNNTGCLACILIGLIILYDGIVEGHDWWIAIGLMLNLLGFSSWKRK